MEPSGAHLLELGAGVLPSHVLEDHIRGRLHRDVQKPEDLGVVEDLGNGRQVLSDVGWVGHAQAQADTRPEGGHDRPQQLGEGSPDVPAVGPGVLTGEPDLNHTLCVFARMRVNVDV